MVARPLLPTAPLGDVAFNPENKFSILRDATITETLTGSGVVGLVNWLLDL